MLPSWYMAVAVLAISTGSVWAGQIEINPIKEAKPRTPRTLKGTEIRLMADGSYQIRGQVQMVDAAKGTLKLSTTGVVEVGPGTIRVKLGGAVEQEFTIAKDAKIIGSDGQEMPQGLKAKVFEKPGSPVTIAFIKKDGKVVVTQVRLEPGVGQPLLQLQPRVIQRPGSIQIDGKHPAKPGALPARRIEIKQLLPGKPGTPAEADRARRLKAIEEQLQKLLKEVQELRAAGPGTVAPLLALARLQALQGQLQKHMAAQRMSAALPAHQPPIIALNRATYTLPKASMEQLTALLKDVKAHVMEVKIEGNNMTVTTTPEAQTTIARFVALFQRLPQPMLRK